MSNGLTRPGETAKAAFMVTITEINGTDFRVCARKPEFAAKHAGDVSAYWERVSAANPRLWNGPGYLFEAVRLDGGILHGEACQTDFATFLYWRDHGRDPSCIHITGSSFALTSDGFLVGMRMAGHTANAGQVYFPAGSFDALDVVDGRLDPFVNIGREFVEETGIAIDPSWYGGPVLAVEANQVLHITRRIDLPLTFAECEVGLAAHRAQTGDDELESLVPLDAASHSMSDIKPYAAALVRHHFGS